MAEPRADAATRFRQLYADNYRPLVGYARRRTASADDAADVVAETFLVAWQRIDAVPVADARPWLFGVARHVIANHSRGARRRHRLAERLRYELTPVVDDGPADPSNGLAEEALGRLAEADREVLRLAAWEGLSPSEMAVVLGCGSGAARVRLVRARRRFAKVFAELADGSARAEAEATGLHVCEPGLGGVVAHG
ncbi:MAG TPA: RNA polymerase sigma factor [Acidimicrobiales bacterium]|nr:RNA polymerase sigma factor [Acidimicrobiales bacterium]